MKAAKKKTQKAGTKIPLSAKQRKGFMEEETATREAGSELGASLGFTRD